MATNVTKIILVKLFARMRVSFKNPNLLQLQQSVNFTSRGPRGEGLFSYLTFKII